MSYRIDQTDPITWRLCAGSVDDGWRLVGTFGSEAAAIAAMGTLIANSQWIAPAAKVYDASGALMIEAVQP